MSLGRVFERALDAAEKLRASKTANEANTKALLIEPVLGALGWDPTDPDTVTREVKVFDGTFLDYALRTNGAARIYVEAKAVGETLTDRKYVAQAINYANNEGVVWCVLTNGVEWHVYKANETAVMDRKILFEVNLNDAAEAPGEVGNMLKLIGRESVLAGELDGFGERTFTDNRVRQALAVIASDPPDSLLSTIGSQLGHPSVPEDALRRSLARVFDAPEKAPKGSGNAKAGPPAPPKGQEYPLDHHLGNKSALITELFNELNGIATALGADVTRRVRKFYVGYYRGKRSFVTVELQQRRIITYLGLDPALARPWNGAVMRDVTNIGHFGMGDTEYSLTTTGQLDEVQQLIKAAYEAIG